MYRRHRPYGGFPAPHRVSCQQRCTFLALVTGHQRKPHPLTQRRTERGGSDVSTGLVPFGGCRYMRSG